MRVGRGDVKGQGGVTEWTYRTSDVAGSARRNSAEWRPRCAAAKMAASIRGTATTHREERSARSPLVVRAALLQLRRAVCSALRIESESCPWPSPGRRQELISNSGHSEVLQVPTSLAILLKLEFQSALLWDSRHQVIPGLPSDVRRATSAAALFGSCGAVRSLLASKKPSHSLRTCHTQQSSFGVGDAGRVGDMSGAASSSTERPGQRPALRLSVASEHSQQ